MQHPESGKQGGQFGIRPHDFFTFLQLLLNQDWLLLCIRLLYYPGFLKPPDGVRSVCSLSVQTRSSHSQSLLHDCIFYLMRLAAAAAKLLQSCPTLCDPIDGSPPGSPVPGILQARTLEWGAIAFSG